MVKQVSVFLENREGRIYEVTSILAKNNINIRALSLADTSDFGILRLIVNEPDQAISILKAESYTVSATRVVAIEVSDKPGGLSDILGIFLKHSINIEYMYAFLGRISDKAIMVFRFDDNDKVIKQLENEDIKLITKDDLYSL